MGSIRSKTTQRQHAAAAPSVVEWCARHGALCAVLAAGLVYLNALPNGFTYDDVPVILNNPATNPAAAWWEPWRQPWWALGEWAGDTDRPYRPLTVQTFAIERRIFDDNPLPFHLFNIVLHAAISSGVWWLARRLGAGPVGALLAGVLFAVHPIHTEAVANIVGRAELLSVGGMLLAVRLYDRHLRRDAPGAKSRRLPMQSGQVPPVALWVCSWGGVLLASAAAVFAKERGVAVVAILAAWHLWAQIELRRSAPSPVLADKPPVAPQALARRTSIPRAWIPRTPAPKALWYGWLIPAIPTLLIVGVYLLLRVEISGTLLFSGQRYGPDNPLRDADLLARVLTPFTLLGRYLWLMVWPARLLCNYSVNVLAPTRTALDGHFVLGVISVLVFVGAVVRLGFRKTAWAPDEIGTGSAHGSLRNDKSARLIHGRHTVALLAVCFVATYFLASNSVLLLETLFAERWFYGPAVWVCVAVGLLAEPAAAWVRRHAAGLRPALVTVCVCAVVAGYGLRTVLRNPTWSSNDVLFRTDLAQMPPGKRSAHLCYLVGKGHLRAGELDGAESLLLEAAAIFPDYPDYCVALGRVYIAAKQFDDAVEWLEQALLLERRNTATRQLLEIARSRRHGGDALASLEAARRAAQDRPDNVEAVRRWADLAEKIDLGEAAAAYRRLTELTPSDPAAWNGLAYALANSGGLDEAAQVYLGVLDRWPDNWEAHGNLAPLLMNPADPQHYQPDQAIEHARRAVELNLDSWQLQLNLAEVLAHCHHEQEAADLFESFARRVRADSPEHKLYLERATYLRKR